MEEKEYRGILIVPEEKEEKLTSLTLQLLGKAKELSEQLGVYLSVVLFSKSESLAKECIQFGADKVYIPADSSLIDIDQKMDHLSLIISRFTPEIILFPSTLFGNELAGRLAHLLQKGLITGCRNLNIEVENRLLVMTQDLYGGKLRTDWVYPQNTCPQLASLAPGAFPEGYRDSYRTGEVLEISLS